MNHLETRVANLARFPRPAALRVAAPVLVVLGLAGCGSSERTEPAPTAPATASAPAPTAPAPAAPPPSPTPPEPAAAVSTPTGPFAVPAYGAASTCPGDTVEDENPFDELATLRAGAADPDATTVGLLAACRYRGSDVARALNAGGLVHHGHGDFERSATWFAKAVRVSPSAVAPRYNLMCALTRLGRLDDAFAQLSQLKRAGDEGAGRIARIARDSDLEVLRGDPRFAAALAESVETVTVDPNPFGLGEPETLRPAAHPDPITITRVLPPTFDTRVLIKPSRIPWSVVRDELGYVRGTELSFVEDEDPVAATDPAATPAPSTPLGSGYVRVDIVSWWSPAPGIVFLVVPFIRRNGSNARNPFYQGVDFFRFEDQKLVPVGGVGALGEWNETNDFGLARSRAGDALYFHTGEAQGYGAVTEVTFHGGQLVKRESR